MVSALTGSEKQVRWAESIRREKMAAPVNGWPVIQANTIDFWLHKCYYLCVAKI